MRTLNSFTFISLDGYFKGSNEDISWNQHGQEESKLSDDSLQARNILLFGRKTYELMARFWPTPTAQERMPVTAKGMNEAQKIVFSRTLKTAGWANTRIANGDLEAEVRQLKQTADSNLTLLGSGSILTQLAAAGLIDEYQFLLNPVALGAGTSVFKDLSSQLNLKLTSSHVYKSGTLLLSYKPA